MTFALRFITVIVLMQLSSIGFAGPHDDAEMRPIAAPKQYGKVFERFAEEMNHSMSKMMLDMHAPGYSGDPDVDFLAMMIAHHEGALTMARLALQHGDDPITRKLAEEIIASQQVEIEGMQRRLRDLKGGASRASPGGYPALGGTRGH